MGTEIFNVIANAAVTATSTAKDRIGNRPSPAVARANPGLGFAGSLVEPWGVRVEALDGKSLAKAYGLKENDVIQRIIVPEKKIKLTATGPENLAKALEKVGPNDTLVLKVKRGKETVDIEMTGFTPRGFIGITMERGARDIPDAEAKTKHGKIFFTGTAPHVRSYANGAAPKGFNGPEYVLGAERKDGKVVHFKNSGDFDRFLQATNGGETVSFYLLRGYKAVAVPVTLKSVDPKVKGSNRAPGSIVRF